eukprot:2562990-Prymnesium_polylepis.1
MAGLQTDEADGGPIDAVRCRVEKHVDKYAQVKNLERRWQRLHPPARLPGGGEACMVQKDGRHCGGRQIVT